MSDFNRLKEAAERQFGKDIVSRIEREITREDNRRGFVDVGDVDFRPSAKAGSDSSETRIENRAASPKRRGTTKTTTAGSVKTNLQQELAKRSKVIVTPGLSHEDAPCVSFKGPISSSSEKLINKAIEGEYTYAKLGLILGLASIIGGVILGLNGVAGSTSWTAKLFGFQSQLNDAAPGVVLFIVGLFMIWITKPRVKMRDLNG